MTRHEQVRKPRQSKLKRWLTTFGDSLYTKPSLPLAVLAGSIAAISAILSSQNPGVTWWTFIPIAMILVPIVWLLLIAVVGLPSLLWERLQRRTAKHDAIGVADNDATRLSRARANHWRAVEIALREEGETAPNARSLLARYRRTVEDFGAEWWAAHDEPEQIARDLLSTQRSE